jgi:hypothetical protein
MITFTDSMPDNASWPRLITASHPRAVGSYGPGLVEWAESFPLQPKKSSETRWWQRLVLSRALEYDATGELCWPLVIVSGPRQTGKSWLERMVCAWRIHQSERFGEEQTVLHVAHKLIAAQEVWRPAARGLSTQGATVRRANGEQQIELRDGSRWLVQAANDGAGVAFSISMALVDEGWRVARSVVDDAIGPTVAESVSPQIWLVSTAGTSESDLMATNRAAALAQLDGPERGSPLIVEWSAPPDPDLDIDDPAVWRSASPHFDERREDAVRRARSSTAERSFRQQWLNQWVPSLSLPLLDERLYSNVLTDGGLFGDIAFAVEVTTDRARAVIVAAGGGVIEVIAEREGVSWVPEVLRGLVERNDPVAVAFDSLGPAVSVGEQLRAELGDKLTMLTGRQVAAASGELWDRLTSDPPSVSLRHAESLHRAVLAAHQRRYGQTWTFARDVIGGVSGAPLAAAALALYASQRPVTAEPVEESRIW